MTIRVLLVDDHDLVRKALVAILDREPHFQIVGDLRSAREAIRQVDDLDPDIVLMDVAMPEMNGIEATRQILARRSRTRILAVSSYTDRRYVNGMLQSGARGYVLKANAYDELCAAIRTVASGKSYVCAEVMGLVLDRLGELPAESSAYTLLRPREREVLKMVAEGLTSSAIAKRLHLSISTVEIHRRNLMTTLDLHNVADLTRYAIREGLTTADV